MNKEELSIVYQSLTDEKSENLSKKEYLFFLDKFPDKDKYDIIKTYKEYEFEDFFLEFDNFSLIYLLSSLYRKSFPFSRSIFKNPDNLRKCIYWYYKPSKTYLPCKENLNDKQLEVISNISKWIPKNPVIQVINAGPGTGKTTTANTLAYSLKDEGVLLISYTNEAVKENLCRFYQYPEGKNSSGFKKYSNTKINLATVDSLASKILGDYSDTNYDQSISRARMNLNPLDFTHPTHVRLYNHVIVDECQDIDDLRGNFILYFCQEIGVKSLSLFGDPRQRIRNNCGKWYQDLWCNRYSFETNNLNPERFKNRFNIGFDITYRFSNQKMLDLINKVSLFRPDFHVSLKMFETKNEEICPIEIITLGILENMIDERNFLEGTCAIIGPSITSDNQTSNAGLQIASIMKKHGKKIMMKNEGAFVPNAIPFLSIHAAKGKEFDNIILFGMDNYPDSFPMIPREEALSLIFVSHSRARKKIYYIHHKPDNDFTIPLCIPKDMIITKHTTLVEPVGDLEKINTSCMRHFSVSNIVKDHSFTKFLEANGYIVNREEKSIKLKNWNFPNKPSKVSSSLWGFISGFYIQCQLIGYKKMYYQFFHHILEDNYSVLSKEIILSETIKGNIVNGISIITKKKIISKQISSSDIDIFNSLRESPNWNKITYLYNKYYNEEQDEFNDDNTDISFENTNINSFVKNCQNGETEVQVTSEDFKTLHGRIDFRDDEKNIYEFKSSSYVAKSYESSLQAWLYHVMTRKESDNVYTHIVDTKNGIIYTLSSSESIYRWKYILRSYFILRHHIDLVNSRRNYILSFGKDHEKEKINKVNLKENSFIADTEFGDNEDVFELALVNIKDPYSSLVDLFLPKTLENMKFALLWLPHCLQKMFTGKISYFRTKFNIICSKSKEIPQIGYYICNTDVNWCLTNFKKIDLSKNARKVTEKSGFFTAGNFGPKLGELYTHLSLCPLEFQEHLQAHQALCDTLMLYELIIMGEIEFS